MAKYTIELGDLVSKGYHLKLDTYPIFDERYRPILNDKIIDHFYTREICTPAPDRFNRFLERRMNEIMPYYNQLYHSERIKYNPLNTNDYTDTFEEYLKREEYGTGTGGETSAEQRDDVYSGIERGKSNEKTDGTLTDNFGKTENRIIKDTTVDDRTTDDSRTTNIKSTNTKTNNLTDTTDTERDENLKKNTTDNQQYWDLPQTHSAGTDAGGNTIYSNGAPTTATSNTGNQTDVNNITENVVAKHTGTVTDDGESTEVMADKIVMKDTTVKDRSDNSTEGGSTAHITDNTVNTSDEKTNDSSALSRNKSSSTYANENAHKLNDEHKTTKHTEGRQMMSPARLIREFRQNFLNIDMLVIDELNDLFMEVF